MKSIIVSGILIIVITVFAFTSSILVSSYLDRLTDSINQYRDFETEQATIIYRALYDDYKRREVWLCMVIDDESLMKIEEDFTDVIAQAEVQGDSEVEISINRLTCHLKQIRRLSGFNIKSVF